MTYEDTAKTNWPRFMGLFRQKKSPPVLSPKRHPGQAAQPRQSEIHLKGGTMDPGAHLRRGRDDNGGPLHGLVQPDSATAPAWFLCMGSFRRIADDRRLDGAVAWDLFLSKQEDQAFDFP